MFEMVVECFRCPPIALITTRRRWYFILSSHKSSHPLDLATRSDWLVVNVKSCCASWNASSEVVLNQRQLIGSKFGNSMVQRWINKVLYKQTWALCKPRTVSRQSLVSCPKEWMTSLRIGSFKINIRNANNLRNVIRHIIFHNDTKTWWK